MQIYLEVFFYTLFFNRLHDYYYDVKLQNRHGAFQKKYFNLSLQKEEEQ